MAVMLRLIGSLSFMWLLMAICAVAQTSPVFDDNGQPLERGVEYYILPAVPDTAGGISTVSLNGSCPFYVGQLPLRPISILPGLPVIFTPYAAEDNIIMEYRDLVVAFSVLTICDESTTWRVGEEDPETTRRLIVTGGDPGYFSIVRDELDLYTLAWCPYESCPTCDRPRCGFAGILDKDGTRFLVLDGPSFPFKFRRV